MQIGNKRNLIALLNLGKPGNNLNSVQPFQAASDCLLRQVADNDNYEQGASRIHVEASLRRWLGWAITCVALSSCVTGGQDGYATVYREAKQAGTPVSEQLCDAGFVLVASMWYVDSGMNGEWGKLHWAKEQKGYQRVRCARAGSIIGVTSCSVTTTESYNTATSITTRQQKVCNTVNLEVGGVRSGNDARLMTYVNLRGKYLIEEGKAVINKYGDIMVVRRD